ncbi:FecR domain-containing protein [Reichenbachiella sp. MALMAid0571]|uniref:FecR family protein n=1 Tax=Reichenbachiella sp. MALMAid0571 TaxID=3143939 RepID=UPI0032E05404
MTNKERSVEDYLDDENFVKSVLYPDELNSTFRNKLEENNQANLRNMELAKKIILSLKVEEKEIRIETIKTNLAAFRIINNVSEGNNNKNNSKIHKLVSGYWVKWAAAAVVVFAVGIAVFYNNTNQSPDLISESSTDEWIIKSNPKGQKLVVSLEDGSIVKLNAESTLKYHANFRTSRMVELTGEAFFEVKRDTLHPFVVKTEKIQTTVLGTSFNVRSYDDEHKSSVVVATGKVAVADNESQKQVILLPSQIVNFHDDEGFDEAREIDLINHIGWKDNVLVFENADFGKIEKELKRWFNVDFEYDSKPIITSFNGEFKNQSLENILEGVRFSTGLKYKLDKQKVIILH